MSVDYMIWCLLVSTNIGCVQGTATPLPNFPQRNASDMFIPGEWATLMLPTHEHLPMLDASGPAYLQRNFSALGFSCDNWQNETITLTVLAVELHGPAGATKSIDDFGADTASLWRHSLPLGSSVAIVDEPKSPSGRALQLVCTANTSSCGPIPKKGGCLAGCISDGAWCQAVATTFVRPSTASINLSFAILFAFFHRFD